MGEKGHLTLRAMGIMFILIVLVLSSVWSAMALGPQPSPIGSSMLSGQADGSASQRYRSGQVVVGLKENVRGLALEDMLSQYGGMLHRTAQASSAQLWLVPEGQEMATVRELLADPRVAYAEPNYLYRASVVPNDPSFGRQWPHTRLRSSAAWDLTTGSPGLTIAIIDTGIDGNHPDLRSKIVGGRDILDGDTDPHDVNGHGTHVAGIAAAVTNNALGVAGMDWQARIMPVRVLGADGTGTNWDIGQGIHWAYQNGAKVINLSLSGPDASQHIREAVDAAYAAGALIVAAMGNCRTYSPPECPVANPTSYPAAYDKVMAVAATTIIDRYTSYSQFGSYCDISAPGGELSFLGDPNGVFSTMPTYDQFFLKTAYGYDKDYDYLQGTSMATAYVSGLAALIWSAKPSLTPDQVQDIIKTTADDFGPPGRDQDYGHGRINALAALEVVAPPSAPTLSPIQSGWFGDYWLNWTVVPSATSYILQEDDNAAFQTPKVLYSGQESQFEVQGQEGGNWYYRVLASNKAGDSPWSNIQWIIVIPKATALDPIDNPTSGGEYEVSWAPSAGATGYKLAETNSPSGADHIIRYIGTETSYKVTGQPEGTWYYIVWPYNSAGDGHWSKREPTTVNPWALSAPNLLGVDNGDGDSSYLVRWQSVAGASSYVLEESPNPYFDHPTEVYSGPALQYAAASQPGGTWYYRVRALGPVGNGPWSRQQSASVRATLHLPVVVRRHATVGEIGGIANGDFEEGPVSWTEFSAHQSPLIVKAGFPQGVVPRSGSWAVWMGGLRSEVSYIQQRVTIPPAKPYLTYWHWIDSRELCGEFHDFGAVLVDGEVVDKYDLCWFESTATWKSHKIDLGAYQGRSVMLQIRVQTNDSLNSNLFVDDVSFQAPSAVTDVPGAAEAGRLEGHIDGIAPGGAQKKPGASRLREP